MIKLILFTNLCCLFLCTDSNKEIATNLVQKDTVSTASTSTLIKKEVAILTDEQDQQQLNKRYDTNPILILSFDQLIDLTINYLQNLETMLKTVSTNSHEKDAISNSIKEEILYLFTGNEVNSYELNEHIKTVLGESMDDIFNGQNSVPLSNFCDDLAHSIRYKLITPFQTTSIKELKKNFGKKFSNYKNSPYPSISKLLTAINLNDIPFDVEGKANEEKQLKKLALWYSDFRKQLLKFEAEHQTDFLNNTLLQKGLKKFGSSLTTELTPPTCKLHLSDNIVNGLKTKPILKVEDLVSTIKTELDALEVIIKASIEAGNFEGSDDVNFFLGIRVETYLSYIRNALEENRFDEYKKIIKDWVASVDGLINELADNEESKRYNYQSKLIALNLSKVFRIEHPLIDFSSFINPLIKEVKASNSTIKLSEIDDLFAIYIADVNNSIYANLVKLYNAEIEKGSLDISMDLLETTLPSMAQIRHAIVSAKY